MVVVMDWIKRAIVGTIVLAFFIATVYSGSALASAVAPEQSADGGQAFTYRVIEERQNALGEHPVLLENLSAHDPSYSELMDFLSTDDTVNNKYDKPNFTCADFAEELQNNAEMQGINCGYASLKFQGKEIGHAVDVFDTTDKGLVYVDTTSGKTIVIPDLGPGYSYYNLGVISAVTKYW
jgi:hypothetical protein